MQRLLFNKNKQQKTKSIKEVKPTSPGPATENNPSINRKTFGHKMNSESSGYNNIMVSQCKNPVLSHCLNKPIKYNPKYYTYEKLAQEILQMKLGLEPIEIGNDAKGPLSQPLQVTKTEGNNIKFSYTDISSISMIKQTEKDQSVDEQNWDNIQLSEPEINITTFQTLDLKTNVNDRINGNIKHMNSLFRSNVRIKCRNALILNLKKKP